MNRMFLAQRCLTVCAGLQRIVDLGPEVLEVDSGNGRVNGGEVARYAHRCLQGALSGTPFVFSSDLTDLVEMAMVTIPVFKFAPSDLRAPSGIVLFDRALPFNDDYEMDREFWWDGFCFTGQDDERGIVVIDFSLDGADIVLGAPGPCLFGHDSQTDYGLELIQAASFRLLGERIVVPETGWMPRTIRRRARFDWARLNLGNLHLWTLREAIRRDHDEHPGTSLTTRHLVSAHWKQQWYPSEGRHAPVLIHTYQRGPKAAPLVIRKRVGVVIR